MGGGGFRSTLKNLALIEIPHKLADRATLQCFLAKVRLTNEVNHAQGFKTKSWTSQGWDFSLEEEGL